MEPDATESHLPPLPGAVPLRRHLDEIDLTLPEWCEENDLDRFSIQKLLNGKLQRVSVELAFGVEEATGGEVKAKLWVPKKQIRLEQHERRREAARARAQALRAKRGRNGNGAR